ncbi:MAG: DUF1491 family protein [Sphingomicrobium sp.]
MNNDRLPTHVEVAALLRRINAEGGFATVIRKGEPERGSVLLFVSERGRHSAALERVLDLDGFYRWRRTGPAESASSDRLTEFLARRTRFDEDLWAIELDIADAERFIAETTSAG